MKVFTLIGGVNGAGKSSLTGSLKAERTDLGVIVDPDKITAETGGDEYEGGKLAVERIERALADGITGNHAFGWISKAPCQESQRNWLLYPPILCGAGYAFRKPAPYSKPCGKGWA